MEIDRITPSWIERNLRALRYGEDSPPEVFEMAFVTGRSSAERIMRFQEFLVSHVEERLAHYRRLWDVPPLAKPPTRAAFEAALAADFAPENRTLEIWSALYHRYIEADFMLEVRELMQITGQNERQFRHLVEAGLKRLVEAVREQERRALRDSQHDLEQADAALQRLYGTEHLRDSLMQLIARPDGPRFVSLEGIGGIGKTVLARTTAAHLLAAGHFNGLIWISARQQKLALSGQIEALDTAAHSLEDVINGLWNKASHATTSDASSALSTDEKLTRLAAALPFSRQLIVLDNLETLAEVETLIPRLRPLAGSTRFLITSRYSLREFDFVTCRSVPELSAQHSIELLRGEISYHARGGIYVSEDDLQRIYAVVGGIPLALKLVAAQAVSLPISRCLEGLQAHTVNRQPEALFTYIYRRTWQLLSDPARRLLFALHDTISPEGARRRWLYTMGEGVHLTAEQIAAAVDELCDYALLDVMGSVDDPIYRLHRLTITFLHTEFRSVI